ncbi:MAG TPA: GIY-YIG nuclease family protein [Bacteroidota bacterium]|nr:GIY-YIG nuclease family protein [Bacteroidota bacterium]
MPLGENISIYLDDGSVTGIRHGQIMGWTGQAIACPRNRIGDLGKWEEAKRPGVYFLFGPDENTGGLAAYIGEAENVLIRLQQHLSSKDFWTEAIFLTSKDETLTSAHAKYLESKFITAALGSRRYQLENGNEPQLPSLPRAERAVMEKFIGYTRILLGTLGHKILEPILGTLPQESQLGISKPISPIGNRELFLNVAGLSAKGVQTNEGIVVLEGSDASRNIGKGLSDGYQKLRETLIREGILIDGTQNLYFKSNQLFNSPSAAASVIVGTAMNGPRNWKDARGRSINEIESEIAG